MLSDTSLEIHHVQVPFFLSLDRWRLLLRCLTGILLTFESSCLVYPTSHPSLSQAHRTADMLLSLMICVAGKVFHDYQQQGLGVLCLENLSSPRAAWGHHFSPWTHIFVNEGKLACAYLGEDRNQNQECRINFTRQMAEMQVPIGDVLITRVNTRIGFLLIAVPLWDCKIT